MLIYSLSGVTALDIYRIRACQYVCIVFLYVCTVPLRVSAGPSLGELFWVGFDLAAPNWPHYQQAVFFLFYEKPLPFI